MGLKIRKEWPYYLLFTLCVGLPYLNIYEVTFAVWCFAILITLRKQYELNFLKYIGLFAGILLIAFLSASPSNTKMYLYLKDITYLVKPILGLLIGYQLCKSVKINPIWMVINTGVFISVIHLILVGYAFVIERVTNINDLRHYAGYFSDYEIYTLILLMFHEKFGVTIEKKRLRWLIAIVAVSSLLYVARTNMIQFVILYFAVKGYLRPTRKSIILVVTLAICTIAAYTAIYNSNPRRGAEGLEGFFYKVKVAPMEPFKTRVNKDDWVDFNDNYRSYENILTVRQVKQDGDAAVWFGKGLGSTIDLKREVWLHTSMMRYIPFLHNGFMTVFLKSGLVGLALYFGTFLVFFRRRAYDESSKYLNRLFLGTGLFLVVSNWVFLGFYNLFDTKSILVGLLLAHAAQRKREYFQ